MRKGIVFATVLSLVGAASAAEINLFWSVTGINNAELMYSTALTNFQPAFVPPIPIDPPLFPSTYDVFLWGQFPADWTDYQIYGLDLRFQGTALHEMSAAYRQRQGSVKRWDGSNGIALDGVMAAVASNGIHDSIEPLVQADGAFLIGAVHVTGALGQTFTVALDTAADGLGINVRDPNGNDVVPDPLVTPATIYFYPPEPASFLLVLATALIRRRGA